MAYDSHHTHRDRHQGSRGSTLRSRLQGRIKLPGRSPDRLDTHSETECDRRQLRDRLSPVRQALHHQERTRRRSSERASSGRNANGQHLRRNVTDTPTLPPAETSVQSLGRRTEVSNLWHLLNLKAQSLSASSYRGKDRLQSAMARLSTMPKKINLLWSRKYSVMVEAGKEGYDNIARSEEYKSISGDEDYKEEGQIPVDGHLQSSSHGDKTEAEDIIEVDRQELKTLTTMSRGRGSLTYEATEGHEYKFEEENAY